MTNKLLHEIGDLLEIRVSPIRFQHGELGIVSPGDSFIAEVSVQLKDLGETADEKALQIKFRRNPEKEFEPERIVMGAKRLRRRAPGDGL